MNRQIKIISALAFLLVFYQTSYSQIKIGTKVGYSVGQLSDNSDNIYTKKYKSISGIDYGLTMEIPFSDLFSIQTEINITHRGGIRKGAQPIPLDPLADALSGIGVTLEQLNQLVVFQRGMPLTDEDPLYGIYNSKNVLNYLEIPIMVRLGWGDEWRFYTQIGPYVGFLLSAKQETSGTTKLYLDSDALQPLQIPNPFPGTPPFIDMPEQSFDEKTDVKDDLQSLNAGIQGGVGLIRKINEKNEVYFDLRGSYGFVPIQVDETFGRSKVGGVIVSIGYTFSLSANQK